MKTISITSNGIYAVAAKVFSMIVPIIVMPYILRVLGSESYGKVAYVQSLIAYFSLIATIGLSDLSLRECSIVRNDKLLFEKKVSQVFTISLFTTAISLLLYILYVIITPDARSNILLYLIFSFMIVSSGLGMTWLYYSLERFDLSSIRDILGKGAYLALCFLFIHNSDDYIIYGGIVVLSTAVIPFALNHYGVWSGKCNVTPHFLIDKDFGPLLKAAFYLGLMTLGSKLFSSSDVILVKWLAPGNRDEAAGLYSSGIMLPLVVEQLVFTIASVITPRLYMYLGNDNVKESQVLTNKISNAMYFVAVPAVVTCLCFPYELLYLLGGEEYLPAINVIRLYSIILITAIAVTLAGTRTYLARRKERKLFIILITMATINIILDIIFVPIWGITGAAFSTVISNVLLMITELTLEKSWGLVFTKEKIKYLAGALIIFIAFSVVKLVIGNHTIMSLIIGVGVAGICYLVFMLITKESTIQLFLQKIQKVSHNNIEKN